MSMSTYGKLPTIHNHAYETDRRFTDPHFPYAAPIYPSQSLGQIVAPSGYSGLAQSTHLTYPVTEARSIYDEVTGSYLNAGTTEFELNSFSPTRGPEYSKINLDFKFCEAIYSNSLQFFLIFGASKRPVIAQKLRQKSILSYYRISADTPPYIATFSASHKVPVSLVVQTSEGVEVNKLVVGEFEYTDQFTHSNNGRNTSGQEICKKRKLSVDIPDQMNSPPRKSICRLKTKEENSNCQYSQADSASLYSYMPTSNLYGPITASFTSKPTDYIQAQNSLRNLHYGYPGTGNFASPALKCQPVSSTNRRSIHNSSPNFSRRRGIVSTSAAHHSISSGSSTSSPPASVNPPLFRISTLQQTPSPLDTPHLRQSKQQFNAYSLYPNKAKLEIVGDLNTMTQNWTDEEMNNRRRLVLFSRSQSGSTIITTFHPVTVVDRPKDSTCISCIYWKEKNDCFITSVDTIALLQKLVSAHFTVEEKNRIRRNLEGFRPMTVSKGKPECDEFFKVIMAFPTPKPRNIEKDVKIFHWSDLSSALKKIIGKYSASPSSTIISASSLLTPISSNGYNTDNSLNSLSYSTDHTSPISPHSLSSSVTSNNLSADILSPQNNDKPKSLPVSTIQDSTNGISDIRIPIHDMLSENSCHGSLHNFHLVQIPQRSVNDY